MTAAIIDEPFLLCRRSKASLRSSLVLICLLDAVPWTVRADWPQFLGPTRDAAYGGNDVAEVWPKEGPRQLWRRDVGEGYAGPVLSGQTVVLFHRVGENEVVEAMETATGKVRWTFAYPTQFRDGTRIDNGPRATPTIADGRVYTLGPDGQLHCLDFKTGAKTWRRDLLKDFSIEKKWHGMACSPIIEGNTLFLILGATNHASLAAFDKTTGSLIFRVERSALRRGEPPSPRW